MPEKPSQLFGNKNPEPSAKPGSKGTSLLALSPAASLCGICLNPGGLKWHRTLVLGVREPPSLRAPISLSLPPLSSCPRCLPPQFLLHPPRESEALLALRCVSPPFARCAQPRPAPGPPSPAALKDSAAVPAPLTAWGPSAVQGAVGGGGKCQARSPPRRFCDRVRETMDVSR